MKKLHVLLIAVLMLITLTCMTMLTVGAEDAALGTATVSEETMTDAEAVAAGFVVRVGGSATEANPTGSYYTTLNAALGAISKGVKTSVYVLADTTVSSGITLNGTYEVTVEGVKVGDATAWPTVTDATGWMLTIKAGANVTTKNVNLKTTNGSIIRVDAGAVDTFLTLGEGTLLYLEGSIKGDIIDAWNQAYITIAAGAEILMDERCTPTAQIHLIRMQSSCKREVNVYGTLTMKGPGSAHNHKIIRSDSTNNDRVNVYDGAVLTYALDNVANSWEASVFYHYSKSGDHGTKFNVMGGTITHTAPYGVVFALGIGKGTTANITGGEIVRDSDAETNNFIIYRATEGQAVVNGDTVRLIAKGNAYIFEQGYCNSADGKIYVTGAYMSTERADKSICNHETGYIVFNACRFDSDEIAYSVGGYFSDSKDPGKDFRLLFTAGKDGVYYPSFGQLLAELPDGTVYEVTEDIVIGGMTIDGKTITFVGVQKPDGTYPTITRGNGYMFTLSNGAKLILENLNIVTNDGAIFNVTGTSAIEAPYNEDGYSEDSTVIIIGENTVITSTDSRGNQTMCNINAGYTDIVVKGKVVYENNAYGKNFYVFRANSNDWKGKLTVFGEISATATKKEDWYHLVRAEKANATVDIRDGARLYLSVTGEAAANNSYVGTNALIWNNGTTYIGNAELVTTHNVIHTSANGAMLHMTAGKPNYQAGVSFFSAAAKAINLSHEDAVLLGCVIIIGDTYYMSIGAAIEACGPDDVIYIIDDYTAGGIIEVKKKVTISTALREDGTRYTLTQTGSDFLFKVVAGGELVLQDINIVSAGASFIQAYGKVSFNNGMNITFDSTGRLVYSYTGCEVTMNGGKILALNTNNLFRNDGGTVVFNGGEIEVRKSSNDVFRNTGLMIFNGGTFTTSSTSNNMFYTTSGANSFTQINGGTFTANSYNCIYADGGEGEINGGTFVQHAGAALQVTTTASWIVKGGFFVGDMESPAAAGIAASAYIIYKSANTAGIRVEGGTYLLNGRSYVFYSVGSDGVAVNYPANNIAMIQKEETATIWNDTQYYYMSFSNGSPVAPVLNTTIEVRLEEGSNGMRFTSVLDKDVYAALQTYAQIRAGEGGTYTLSFGTMIAPVDSITTAGALTMEAFDAAGLPYVNIPATSKGSGFNDAGDFVMRAAIVNINKANYDRLFTAVPYVLLETENGTEIMYGAHNTSKSAAISSLVLPLLNDVTDVPVGEYIYASITIPNAYSRFTKEEQETLQGYLSHVHTNDYKGVCSECGTDSAVELPENTPVMLYSKYDNAYYFRIQMQAGIDYLMTLSADVMNLTLYTAEGEKCEFNGTRYTCTADGTYYLVASAAKVGSATITFQHSHVTDYKGYCSVCETSFLQTLAPESSIDYKLIEGEHYYFSSEFVGGLNYLILTINGDYTVYDADGNVVPVNNSVMNCPADGTYYIVVKANISAKGGISAKHVHTYDYTGVCILDTCRRDIAHVLGTIYNKVEISFTAGEMYYFNVELQAGNTYYVAFSTAAGVWSLHAPDGTKMSSNASGGGFTLTESGTYYLVLTAETTQKSSVWFEIQHTCTYTPNGVCEVCTKNIGKTMKEDTVASFEIETGKSYYYMLGDLANGATYEITAPEGLAYKVYGKTASGYVELTVTDGKIVWDAANGNTIYIVIEATSDAAVQLKIAHVHERDYKGSCTVKGCKSSLAKVMGVGTTDSVVLASGETAYYTIAGLEAGVKYGLAVDKVEAVAYAFDESGNAIQLDEDATFVAAADGTCYIVLVATADSAEGATFLFGWVVEENEAA